MIGAFTSANIQYLPKVRVLFRSLRQQHPEIDLHLLLVDTVPSWLDPTKEAFDTTTIEDLGVPGGEKWIFQHSLVELSTAVKPFMLKKLMERYSTVFYFDPDIVVWSRLDDLLQITERSSIVLTPHVTEYEATDEGVRDNELSSLKHGVYNLGFIGVRNDAEGREFATWWGNRVHDYCTEDVTQGLFTDQRWIDLAPAIFDNVTIVRNPRFNVAPWNLSSRNVTGSVRDGLFVNGTDLGFYHFTGFDSGAHEAMASKYAKHNGSVGDLITWYKEQTKKDTQIANTPWEFASYDNGQAILPLHRQIYRERVDLQVAYPNPFEVEGMSYYTWLMGQGPLEYPEAFGRARQRGWWGRTSDLAAKVEKAGGLGPAARALLRRTSLRTARKAPRR